ncbi:MULTISPECIES: hypothetical protein [unclassified Campylobacter]|uniref:hypothetical protein n=1 Tax=unclassified Campylobacter TaxID=2593542 RepID=UPI00147576CB|nr:MULTISPECIES: hypothetical protein [unclassified Campylobacter]
MKELLKILNKNTPQKIDHLTTFTRAICENGNIVFINELNNAEGIKFDKFDKTQIPIFKNIQHRVLKSLYCDSLTELHELTSSIIWRYNLGDKKFTEFEFKKSDCKR